MERLNRSLWATIFNFGQPNIKIISSPDPRLLMQKHLYFILFSTFFTTLLTAQRGRVTAPDGAPLAFVSIRVESDSPSIAFTDIDGIFQLNTSHPVKTLIFRYVGYKDDTLRHPVFPLNIVMQPADLSLNEVEIFAGENPAHRLIRAAIAQRHRNNPERSHAYTCTTYNKMVFEALPHPVPSDSTLTLKQHKRMAKTQRLAQMMEKHHLLLMESVTERSFIAPDIVQEKVIHNRVSGFKNAGVAALTNAIQPFSFYGDNLIILDKKFVNPISPGSTKKYFFQLQDTLYEGSDTVWIIAFRPATGKVFMGLKGVLHLHSRHYAVQHVRAGPAFGNENFDMNIEQAYQFIPDTNGHGEGQWFPQQLNFELITARYPSPETGLRMTGHSFIRNAVPNAPLRFSDVNPEQPVIMMPDADSRDTALWNTLRGDSPFSLRDGQTYIWLDSIGQKRHFDFWAKAINAASTNVWPLYGPVGLRLERLIRLNEYEKVRLGAGITNRQQNPLGLAKKLEWGAAAGIGIADQKIKYDAYLLWRIFRGQQTQLQLIRQRELQEPGVSYELSTTGWLNRSLYALRTDLSDEWRVRFSTRIGRALRAALTWSSQQLQPAGYEYTWVREPAANPIKMFHFEEVTVYFRAAYGERVYQFLGQSFPVQRFPAVETAYTYGRGTAPYQRALAAVEQSVPIPRLGYLQWRLEAGQVWGNPPMARLFTFNQSSGSFNLFVLNGTFQHLPDTLFLHQRYLMAFVRQEIGPVGWQRSYSAPFLSVLHQMAWGDLTMPEQHQGIGFAVLPRPYLETGLRIDNLLRVNYLNFGWFGGGFAAFYRWGAFSSTQWERNLAVRFTLKFTL